MLNTDPTIDKALCFGWGLRLLKQDLWEMLISFIISQNNNIPRIKKNIQALCEYAGTPLQKNGFHSHSFPTLTQMRHIAENQLKDLGVGYRAAYIVDAVQRIDNGEIDLASLQNKDTQQAREILMQIKGIGGKVADCILLFGMSRYEVCPHDTWVKRIFSEKYHIQNINEKRGYAFARSKWGGYAGIAQQYLFYCEREHQMQKTVGE